jgi:hypothetical protein
MSKRAAAPSDRIYEGWVEKGSGGPGVVKVTDPGRRARKLDPRSDIRNHSPDGFQWGYAGSGPAQLALALVADATGDDDLTRRTYQRFKFKVVAGLGEAWKMTAGDIVAIVAELAKREDA